MEEDIKILESYLEQQDRKFVSEYRLKFLQAIENLINRNKELEETLKDNWEFRDKFYIPKSKVEKLIEHLEGFKGLVMYDKYNYEVVIRHLQELLEKE